MFYRRWLNLATVLRRPSPVRRNAPKRARLRLEPLEERIEPGILTVSSAADPDTLTAGTLRYAVSQADTDAAAGVSDTIEFASALDGQTITLSQGTLSLNGAGTGTITIKGANQISLSASALLGMRSSVISILR